MDCIHLLVDCLQHPVKNPETHPYYWPDHLDSVEFGQLCIFDTGHYGNYERGKRREETVTTYRHHRNHKIVRAENLSIYSDDSAYEKTVWFKGTVPFSSVRNDKAEKRNP